MNLSNKVIYVVATGCRRSRELPLFIKKLEKKGAKIYLFATEECKKIVDFSNEDFKSINLRLNNNVQKTEEIEKEDLIIVTPCSFNTLNKIANGISDSYPLTIVHTAIGRGTKVILSLSMNVNLWNNYNTSNSIKKLSDNNNLTIIWPEIKKNEQGEIITSMVSWDKIEDTIMANLHILPYEPFCTSNCNTYNSEINELYNEMKLAGYSCKEIKICPNRAGCIAKKVENGVLISATGADVGNLTLEDMVLITDRKENTIYYSGSKKPSTESIIAWELLKEKEVGTCFIHCHCRKITYSEKSNYFTTKNYFMSENEEQIEEVKSIINKYGYVNLKLHGQIFIDKCYEIILGKIVNKYCEIDLESEEI